MVIESIIADIGNMVLPYLPDSILGIDIVPFVGLLIGIAIACYEGMRTKFVHFKVTKTDGTEVIKFDNRYLVSGIMAVLVTYFTVDLVVSAGSLNGITSFGTALFIGLTEGAMVVKTINRRVDIFIKKSAEEAGLSSEQAQSMADSVEFVEMDSSDSNPMESPSNEEKRHHLTDCFRKNGKTFKIRKTKTIRKADAPSEPFEFEDVDCKTLVVKKRYN